MPANKPNQSNKETQENKECQENDALMQLFSRLFYARYRTRLVPGGEEPLYLPASMTGDDHQIIFARGYFNSALHELAHWCVAGPERRALEDYGYWYQPDGRSPAEQRAFEQVEVLPQAYEHCFTLACGRRFHISADNLSGQPGDTSAFEVRVHQKTLALLFAGQLKGRAKVLFEALCQQWQRPFASWQAAAQTRIRARLAELGVEHEDSARAAVFHSRASGRAPAPESSDSTSAGWQQPDPAARDL